MNVDTGFFLVLCSNVSSKDIRGEENTTSHFFTKLSRNLDLEGQWGMALVEAVYPVTFCNITTPITVKLEQVIVIDLHNFS
jgi:hypothetical protein